MLASKLLSCGSRARGAGSAQWLPRKMLCCCGSTVASPGLTTPCSGADAGLIMNDRPPSSLITLCSRSSGRSWGHGSWAFAEPANATRPTRRINLSFIITPARLKAARLLRKGFRTLLRRDYVQQEIVHDKRSFQVRIFNANQIDLNRLSFVSRKIERHLRIARGRIQVRVGGQRGQHRS